MLSLILLVSPTLALAQAPPALPAEPAPAETEAVAEPAAEPAPPAEAELPPEEPPMKKVCRTVEVVGSAIGRTVCTMKPVRASKPKGE
ncbi:MAG: hypothetical protein ABIU10_08040 [Sphingomicrobium sp.]